MPRDCIKAIHSKMLLDTRHRAMTFKNQAKPPFSKSKTDCLCTT